MLDGEEKLIKEAVGGKSSAFGSIYDYYVPMIYRFVYVKVGRREDAEDITHQVFLSAWQNIKNYENRGYPFGSWLYRIARNLIVDHYRAKKPESSLEKIDPENFIAAENSELDTATKLEVDRIMSALQKLKPEYQDVIILRFIEDMPLKEVARTMDRTEGAIKLLQHRAVKELKRETGVEDMIPNRLMTNE